MALRASPLARRVALALGLGLLIGGVAALGEPFSPRATDRARCWQGLRLLRLAIAAFEEDFGRLPGLPADLPVGAHGREATARLLMLQLAAPVDRRGMPVGPRSSAPPRAGRLLGGLPMNPYTRSREIVIVPDGDDAVAFAAESRAGWAYLAAPGRDRRGWLPAGVLIPCGRAPEGEPPPQSLAFELEDRIRWR